MKITVLNTGGTFNKRYNPLLGELEVPSDAVALDDILKSMHNVELEIINIISKDSLDITNEDRECLVNEIKKSPNEKIIIVHGTDTIDLTSDFIAKQIQDKTVVLTGAMVPMSIDKVEATINFSLALGFLNATVQNGVYIAMHGAVAPYKTLTKNRTLGQFLLQA
ncbi:MAG: asparaginase domain-containing protein [Candidatus Marinarcus sp.]|uniref:asparaginase domain-containing protein n=1 Tax=Candidatus Marinarcus sp. TaxID=3100987 RepID=UPI003B002AF5